MIIFTAGLPLFEIQLIGAGRKSMFNKGKKRLGHRDTINDYERNRPNLSGKPKQNNGSVRKYLNEYEFNVEWPGGVKLK